MFQKIWTKVVDRLTDAVTPGAARRAWLKVVALLVPGFRVRPDTLPALRVINEIASITAGGETRRVAKDARKDHPSSGFAGLLQRHAATPGRDVKALLLEKSKSWAPATVVQLRKMLTKRYRASAAVIALCCFKEGRITPAASTQKTFKQQIAQPQIEQKESTKRARDVKVLTRPGGHRSSQASAGCHDIFHAASLHTGSSSERTSDTSQLKIQRSGVRIMKKNEHFTSGEESPSAKRAQGQRASKAAASAYNEDGFYVDRLRSLTSTEKAESINGPIRDDNGEDFSGKEITKQADLQSPEGESETEQTHTNAIGNGNQKRLASILHAGSTHKRDNKDVDHKQLLTEVGKEILLALFLADTERQTQTEASSKGELLFKTEWETVNILTKEPGDPRPMTKVLKENFIIEVHDSKCTCLGEVSLEMHALDRAEWRAIKPAQSKVTTVPTYTEEHTQSNGTPHKNMNHTKQEENEPSGESVTPSTPSLNMMQLETAKAEHTAETTTVNTEIKETTSSAEKEVGPPSTEETPTATAGPQTEAEPRFIRCQTGSTQPAAEKSLSGLRMREDFPAYAIKLYGATEDGERDATNRPDTRGKGVQNDSQGNAFTFAEPPQTIHRGAADELPKITEINKPLCGGLIHRTEAGWRHCVERFTGVRSDTFPLSDPADAFEDGGGLKTKHTSVQDHKALDDEYDHFYYFDGVLKRVQNNFFPHQKRQRRWKRSADNEGNRDNLLGYIRRLTLRNKLSRFK